MFHRIALVPIGMLEQPTGSKLVFASEGEEHNVSFDYRPEDNVYFRCRAITAGVANGNGDLFPEDELKKSYKSFIGVGLYKDHDSGSVDKSIGKVLWAEWIEDGKYVECYCAVDKKLAPDLAHRVKSGIVDSVSMGCSVQEAECSICGNTAHNINELCPHMTPGSGVKGRRGSNGQIIAEINRGIQFNELSLVTVPADSTARVFEIYAALNKKAAEEKAEHSGKDEQKNPLLRDDKATYANMFTPKHQQMLADFYAEKEKLDAAGADKASPDYADLVSSIKWMEDMQEAKELAGNYMRLSTPLYILMYDQYNKLKDDGVPDEQNPFVNAARLRDSFAQDLRMRSEYDNHGRDPEKPGVYGLFLRWMMHSNLPDGTFGYQLYPEFRDGSDPNGSPDEATDSVKYRRNFIDAKTHGPFPGMMLPVDQASHAQEVKRAFRDSVLKHIPQRQSTQKKRNIAAYIENYFNTVDEVSKLINQYGSLDVMPKEAEDKLRKDYGVRLLGLKSLLMQEHADSTSSKSLWDVLLDYNSDYLGLRKKDPELKTYLKIAEPPKEAPQGLEGLVGRDDAIEKYLELQNSPVQKALKKHQEKGLPLSKETLLSMLIKDNGVDEGKFDNILKTQGFDEKLPKITEKFKNIVLDHYNNNKPFNKGQQMYLDRLLSSEAIQIAEGAKMMAPNEKPGTVDPKKDPWENNYPIFKSDDDKRAEEAAAREKKLENSLKKGDPAYSLKKELLKMIDGLYIGHTFVSGRQFAADLSKVPVKE